MKECVIETNALSKTYGSQKVLDRVSIHVERGEIYGLIGDNGAGKSTLFKVLAGKSLADAGELALFGQSTKKGLVQSRARMGVLVEEAGFFPSLSVEQNLEYYRRLKGIPGKACVGKVMAQVGLLEKRQTSSKKLSMGMKKRLGIAIALLGDPELLILDEPINGLDPSSIVGMRRLLQQLNTEHNTTILMSSHILSELQQTATTFGFLEKGQLIRETTAQALHDQCMEYLTLMVSDIEGYLVLLEEYYPEELYKVLPDRLIQLMNPKHSSETYSALAAKNGILVTGMAWHEYTLEDYFMQLKEGERDAELSKR